ncbi:MAG: hypothetical protein CL844_02705 [Crocinitomicaceae bacterium]|nr:hypothetical protein [Crocinitomicaceae bacterium]
MKVICKYRFLLIFLFSLNTFQNLAQKTTIYGNIKEDSTFFNIMYAKVHFKGTQVGTTSDSLGMFKLSIPNEKLMFDSLIISYLGFKTKKIPIKRGEKQEINILLSSTFFKTFDEVRVIAGENPAWKYLRKIIKNKTLNNPQNHENYSNIEYSKTRFDLNNFTDKIKTNILLKPFDYIWENTKITKDGINYLPVLLSERIIEHYYQKSPKDKKDIIIGDKTTGLAGPKLKEFTNDLYITPNIYNNYITILGKSFPSPLNNNYKNHYKFYLMDSIKNEAEQTYIIKFLPKYKRQLAFTGEMEIDSSTLAVKKIQLRFDIKANVNFVRSYYISQSYKKINDYWTLSESNVIGDFTVLENSSDLTGFFGRKKSTFTNNKINSKLKKNIFKGIERIEYTDSSSIQNDFFWENYRTESLSEEEIKLLKITKKIENDPSFKIRKNIFKAIGNGYIPFKTIEIGNLYKLYSFNNIENNRFNFSIRTKPNKINRFIFSGNIGYGTKDKKWKYNLISTINVNKNNQTRFGIKYNYDIKQIGRSFNQIELDHILSSLIQIGNTESRNYVGQINFYFEQILWTGTILRLGYFRKTYSPTNNDTYKSINEQGNIEDIDYYNSNGIDATFKFNYLFKKITGEFYDKNDFPEKYPSFTLNFKLADQSIFKSSYSYQKITASIKQKVNTKKIGYFNYNIESGKTYGVVPHLDLDIPFGNQLILTDDYAFNLMNFMEFASDQYISIYFSHHFEGLILDKIPLINRLKWRTFMFGRTFIGGLSEKNNQMRYLFPENLIAINKPYYEVGFGLENIFKFAKIDFTWRLSEGQGEYYRFLIKPGFKFSF